MSSSASIPVPIDAGNGQTLAYEERDHEETVRTEQERRSFASTFDRLVESNLQLTKAVTLQTVRIDRLVMATYLVLAASVVTTLVHGIFR